MRCSSCGFENANGSLFCQQCGHRFVAASSTPETVVCGRCGSAQPPHMRFCTACGSSLPGPAHAGPGAAVVSPIESAVLGAPMPGAPAFAPPAAPGAPAFTSPAAAPSSRENPFLARGASPAIAPLPRAYAPESSPLAAAGAEVAERLSSAIGAPLCWRCRGVGDTGAEFCKFCGVRYVDNPARAPQLATGPAPTTSPPPAMGPGMLAHGAAPFDAGHAMAGAPASPYGAPAPRKVLARLVSILKDGTDGQAFDVTGDQTDIGRSEGDVLLADDPYLSPRHARLRRRPDGFHLRDLDTVNGVYVRVRESADLTDGDMILIGQQVLRFEVLAEAEVPLGPAAVHGVFVFGTPEAPRIARLVQYTTEGIGRDVVYLYRAETVLGRETGDVVFTDDPFLSRRHAAIRVERGSRRFVLKDLGSSNGTSLRMRGERPLAHNDLFRIGKHLFRFELAGSGQGAP